MEEVLCPYRLEIQFCSKFLRALANFKARRNSNLVRALDPICPSAMAASAIGHRQCRNGTSAPERFGGSPLQRFGAERWGTVTRNGNGNGNLERAQNTTLGAGSGNRKRKKFQSAEKFEFKFNFCRFFYTAKTSAEGGNRTDDPIHSVN